MENLLFSGEVHTHKRKIPKPKNREAVFCIRGVLFTESIVQQRERKTTEDKRVQEKTSREVGNLTHSYRTTKEKCLDPKSSCHSYTEEIAVEITFRGFCTL